jgi:hypothetical protein
VGKPFIITPQAQRDFDKTYWWYEEQYQGLGKEFALCVDAKIEEIQRFPEQFQRFEYGAFGNSTQQTFNLLLCLFITITFIFSTICQMHYIFC